MTCILDNAILIPQPAHRTGLATAPPASSALGTACQGPKGQPCFPAICLGCGWWPLCGCGLNWSHCMTLGQGTWSLWVKRPQMYMIM